MPVAASAEAPALTAEPAHEVARAAPAPAVEAEVHGAPVAAPPLADQPLEASAAADAPAPAERPSAPKKRRVIELTEEPPAAEMTIMQPWEYAAWSEDSGTAKASETDIAPIELADRAPVELETSQPSAESSGLELASTWEFVQQWNPDEQQLQPEPDGSTETLELDRPPKKKPESPPADDTEGSGG